MPVPTCSNCEAYKSYKVQSYRKKIDQHICKLQGNHLICASGKKLPKYSPDWCPKRYK